MNEYFYPFTRGKEFWDLIQFKFWGLTFKKVFVTIPSAHTAGQETNQTDRKMTINILANRIEYLPTGQDLFLQGSHDRVALNVTLPRGEKR